MSHIIADRVKETTTTSGTGSLTLNGAATGFRAFSAVCANNDTVDYVVSSSGGSEWEVGLGTWQTGNILARTTVRQSSNGGAAVSFSAGTKDVYGDINALRFNRIASAFLDVSFTGGSQTIANAFTKITGFSVTSDPGSNWSAANQWYVVPVSGRYLVQTLFRMQDSSAAPISYGHGSDLSAQHFVWGVSNSAGAARNGAVSVVQSHYNAADTIYMQAYWDSVTPATVDSAALTISLLQVDQ